MSALKEAFEAKRKANRHRSPKEGWSEKALAAAQRGWAIGPYGVVQREARIFEVAPGFCPDHLTNSRRLARKLPNLLRRKAAYASTSYCLECAREHYQEFDEQKQVNKAARRLVQERLLEAALREQEEQREFVRRQGRSLRPERLAEAS